MKKGGTASIDTDLSTKIQTIQRRLIFCIGIVSSFRCRSGSESYRLKLSKNKIIEKVYCAADFSLLNLPKGKSLGRSKPATNS